MTEQADPPYEGRHGTPEAPPSPPASRPIPRAAGGDGVGPDPSAPPVPHEDPRLVGSNSPFAMTGFEGAEPVLGSAPATLTGGGRRIRLGDRVFSWLTAGASTFIVVLVALVAVFLLVKSVPSILHDKVNFLTSTEWDTTSGDLRFGIAPLLYTTVAVSVVAMVFAVPVAIGIALFITHYAPKRLSRPVAYAIDLLAAIPSIIYGVWGIRVLAPHLTGLQKAISTSSIPFLEYKGIDKGTVFVGGVVLAVMILPIVTAISRDVFERTPRANIEAAYALGATKWEMVRMAVLPYGRAGIVSGAMLGLGRALGETIAVLFILSKVSNFSVSIFSGGETFASKIANNASEFSNPASTGAYIAAGLVLFVLTFVVNAAARAIVNRRRDFS